MTESQRTTLQNRALHKFFELLADSLNAAGYDLKTTLEAIGNAEVPWSKESIKEVLWRPIMVALINKHSTRELTTSEVDEVYIVVMENISRATGVYVDFPHYDASDDVESYSGYREARG